ncbi:hypothetical protein UFOVP84_10 [uncultured Caudovirales phage]|uniref:Uncharacterized protein n=1 Tax=uncultured Caudovirales phage TaxID=2100421 RepID=A0A6J5KVU6_9CAUD|nr:hypothetical protein UFOVP84_10 [uncultured Caudovirales phage]
MSDIINKAGDVNIELIQITTSQGFYQDITNQVMGLQIFEDLFAPFTTGTLEIRDSLDLLNVFPFNGEEYLDLKISTPSLDKGNIDGKFYIYKMSNRVMLGDRATVYTLNFISIEALADLNKKISKTFSGKCSDIAKELLADNAYGLQPSKPIVVEDTQNATKYISNFWSPIKNLNNVAETSVNTNGSGSYVFFEDRYGFNFVSLESLYQKNNFQEFIYDSYVRDTAVGTVSVRNVTEDYKRIRSINIATAYDYMERVQSGMYGSKLYTHDLTTKRFEAKLYNMLDNFASQKHLNEFPLASNRAVYKYNSMIMYIPKFHQNFSNFGDSTNANSMQNRVSLFSQIDANKLEIVVPGRLDYTVGIKVLLKLYKIEPQSKSDTSIIDDMLSGNYIIAAINHYINRNMHECTIELVKESLLIDLDRKK